MLLWKIDNITLSSLLLLSRIYISLTNLISSKDNVMYCHVLFSYENSANFLMIERIIYRFHLAIVKMSEFFLE